ncbi:helix-turn-helix domain-containing protein [Paenibacillus terreus]|uniref:Helix-turn-helix domain-containing protein n=1 Tax=Paenibacillus terreus TaxID=1387834 RepID=A0ABV5B662_9BACL
MRATGKRKNIPVIPAPSLETGDFRLLRLNQEMHGDEPELYDLHRHDCYELFWIMEGHGKVQIDFQSYSFSPNTLSLIAPGQIHGWIAKEIGMAFDGYLLIFSKDLIAGHQLDHAGWLQTSLLNLMGDNPFYNISPDHASVFNELFRLLERELAKERKDQTDAVRSYIRLLLIEAGRIHDQWQQGHREEAGFRLTKQYLSLVESHFRTVNSVSDYASMLHVTTSHLIESVKKTLGKSAGEVLRERQLLEAKRLLRYSSSTVDEIAHHLGFHDPSYFGRLFKKNVGLSPTAFRRQG